MPVTVGRYDFPYEAHIARARLESEGIPAFVVDEHTINMQWLYSQALGGVKVQVPERFAEEALAILNEDRSSDLPDQETRACRVCGGHEFEHLARGRPVAYFLFWFFGFPLWKVKRQIRCKGCGDERDVET